MSTGFKNLVERMLSDVERVSGKRPDVCVVGTDKRAKQVRDILIELKRDHDVHVIADNEISPNTCWVTTMDALGQIPGGGRN